MTGPSKKVPIIFAPSTPLSMAFFTLAMALSVFSSDAVTVVGQNRVHPSLILYSDMPFKASYVPSMVSCP
jgi:hypothetical protein